MIDLYGMSSPNVLKIIIGLEDMDVSYNYHFIDVAHGEQFEPAFTALNPMQKVPVIIDHDGLNGERYTVFESGAILYYLARKIGKFFPTETAAQIETMQWLMVQMANVGPMFGQLNHFLVFAPEGNQYSFDRYRTLSGRIYDMLDKRLASVEYLAGNEYSIADIATFAWVELYHQRHGMNWSDHPHLRRWCDTVGARPAVKRSLARYEALQAEDPSFIRPQEPEKLDLVLGRGKFTRA